MPVYDRTLSVGQGKLDPELEAWLPTGPIVGQFTRWSQACYTATIELAELIKARIG